MELGLIGLPRAGKTTLFSALTGLGFDAASARQSHTAVVRVPDPRIDRLSAMFKPRKTTLAEVAFVDPAAERHEPGAERVAFPEAVAAVLRDVDALVHVVRVFEDPSVPRPPGSTTPAGDVEAIEQELVLRDLGLVERRLERLRKEKGKPENAAEQTLLEQAFAHLDTARPLRELPWGDEQWGRLRGFQFLSSKPALVVLNIGESDLATPVTTPAGLERFEVLALSAKVEREIAELPAEDQREFLDQMGLEQPARDVFIRAAYGLLRLISFFTVGEDEVRAWPVTDGSSAWVAAGKIHSDIQRGFIRAEAIHTDEFLRCGSLAAAKTQGLLRLEGKEYRVRDGDIFNFRFSV